MKWVNRASNTAVDIVDKRHDDHQFWAETFAHENWVDESIEGADPAPPRTSGVPTPPRRTQVPEFAWTVSREEAAEGLGVSVQHFDRHVRPHLREVKSGRLVLYPVSEIEKFVNDNARRALGR